MADPPSFHGSCVSRDGHGVLLLGQPGAGKSDLVLRLLATGFELVADDRTVIADGIASCPQRLGGLLEVRGLGILKLPYVTQAKLALVVELDTPMERLPEPRLHAATGLPMVRIDPDLASAPERVRLALECALGRIAQVAGAFAA